MTAAVDDRDARIELVIAALELYVSEAIRYDREVHAMTREDDWFPSPETKDNARREFAYALAQVLP